MSLYVLPYVTFVKIHVCCEIIIIIIIIIIIDLAHIILLVIDSRGYTVHHKELP